MFETDVIRITDVEGIARKSGRDAFGARWIEFESDAFACEEPGTCAVCGQEIESGFVCLDGAETVCSSHVEIVPALIVDSLAGEVSEVIDWHNRLVAMRCEVGQGLVAFGARQMANKYLGWTEPAST